MIALSVLVPLYVIAFYTGSFQLRAAGGTALLLAIAWALVWVWRQFLAGERSFPDALDQGELGMRAASRASAAAPATAASTRRCECAKCDATATWHWFRCRA